MQKSIVYNSEKFEKFFAEPFDFSSRISLEKHIIQSVGHELITPEERSKIILKTSFMRSESGVIVTYQGGHPVRKFVTKLMQIMRSLEPENVLFWMNHLQSDEVNRSTLQRCWRSSIMRMSENWQTHAFRVWSFPTGQKWQSFNCVIILPSRDVSESYKHLDGALNNFGFSSSTGFVRRNKHGLPPFCMHLNMDLLNECIIEMK